VSIIVVAIELATISDIRMRLMFLTGVLIGSS
jgi:hypothetical protein